MSGLFGFRAVAEAVDLDVREVMGMVRSGYGDRLAGMVSVDSQPVPRGRGGRRSSVQPPRSASMSTGMSSPDPPKRSPDPPPRFLRGFSDLARAVPRLCRVCAATHIR